MMLMDGGRKRKEKKEVGLRGERARQRGGVGEETAPQFGARPR